VLEEKHNEIVLKDDEIIVGIQVGAAGAQDDGSVCEISFVFA